MKWEEILEKAKDENGNVTVDSVKKVIDENKVKLVDLSEDGYVSKNKYTSDLKAKTDEIETLNGTIKTRDKDLEELKTKLADAGADADKLGQLQGEFDTLKTKYEDDAKAYKAQIAKQANEFACREYAGALKFTSTAAKREFERAMIAENLKLKDNTLIGADDFLKVYKESNADSFVVEKEPEPNPQPAPAPQPMFAASTPGEPSNGNKPSLSDMMKMANDNPGMSINF